MSLPIISASTTTASTRWASEQDESVEIAPAHRQSEIARKRCRQPVGNGPRLDRHGSAGFEREAHGCRIDGLDAIDPDRGSTLLQGGRDPGDQTASADPDDHDVDLGQILEDLEADAAVAGDHRRILEWV